MNRNEWGRLVTLEQEFKRRGEIFSRIKIADTMQVSDGMARLYEYALKNKDVIRYSPNIYGFKEKEKIGVLADIHFPYQDDSALEAATRFLEDKQIDTIVILGDAIDFYKISRFTKNPKKKSVKKEMTDLHNWLKDLRLRFPKARILYKKGNHEERLDTYIMSEAAEIYDLVDDLLENKLTLKNLKIDFIEDPFRIGRLWFLHGHEKPGGSYNPEYVCNVIFKYVLDHFLCGHFHRNQTKPFKRISGKSFWGGSLGYLAGTMDFAKINQWNQGVAIIKMEKDGFFRPDIRFIEGGEVY